MIQPKIQEVADKRHKEYSAYLNTLERNEIGGVISYLPKENWLLKNYITFTPEEFETFKREFGGKLLEKAADNAEITTQDECPTKSIQDYSWVNKESITSVLDEYLKENKIGLGDL